nr:class I SAM-dependent methyltransferase [Ardenticatena sp.]
MRALTLDTVAFLRSERAQRALARLAHEDLRDANTLALLTRLRRDFSPDEAAALLDQARLRQRAVGKFPHPEALLYTDEALQQASSRAIACYRAERFAVFRHVADLGCGIGADTIALAEVGCHVLAIERDPVRAALAEANIATLGLADRVQVVCADWTMLTLDTVEAAFADPARRRSGRRLFHVRDLEPPLDHVLTLRERLAGIAVKLHPGIQDEEVPPDAALEFISEHGTCKEALLTFGALQPPAQRLATCLPGPHHLVADPPAPDIRATLPHAWLYEPDCAVIRAGAVRHLAAHLDATLLDTTIAYLSNGTPIETPLARRWRILRHGPFHLKTLKQWLRALNPREIVVKKRGFAVDPMAFRQRLPRGTSKRTLTIFLTRCQGRPWMLVAADQ